MISKDYDHWARQGSVMDNEHVNLTSSSSPLQPNFYKIY